MKSTVAIQVIAVLLLVASAASCEVAKEYSNRVFKPTTPQKRTDSTTTALKFMQFDSGNASDSIDLKDLAITDVKENDTTEVLKDSGKIEVTRVENKIFQKEQPVEPSRRGTTRTKKIRQ